MRVLEDLEDQKKALEKALEMTSKPSTMAKIYTVKVFCSYIHEKKIAIPHVYLCLRVLAIARNFFGRCVFVLRAACHVYPWLEYNLLKEKKDTALF